MSGKLKASLIGFGLLLGVAGILAAVLVVKPFRIQDAHDSFVTDFRDDRRLAGAVHNIFIGRVVSNAGTKSLDGLPETQFHVEVLEPIKGRLSGTVVVNQQGGYRDNQLVLMEGDQPLETGRTYLFATRTHPTEGWHTLVPNYGDLPVRSEAERASLTARFRKAADEEIPWKFDNPGAKK